MNNHRIFETQEFQRKISALDPPLKVFVERKLRSYIYPQIKTNPFFGKNIKKLKGHIPEVWRYRFGRFRIFYTVDEKEKIVYMLTIDQRKYAYR